VIYKIDVPANRYDTHTLSLCLCLSSLVTRATES
jgi:hypothetical protein